MYARGKGLIMSLNYFVNNFIENKVSLLEGEVFKPISRAPGYEISNYGRVRQGLYGKFVTVFYVERIQSMRCKVVNSKGEQTELLLTHEVMKAFNHPHKKYLKKHGHRVCFKDGNPYNCKFDNLEVRRLDGKPLQPPKPKTRYAYWTHPDRVRAIKYDIFKGFSDTEIAKKYKMQPKSIWRIRHGQRQAKIK